MLVAGSAVASRSDEPAPPPQSLTVHVKVVRVNVTKLKNLGFDWVRMVPGGRQTVPIELSSLFKKTEHAAEAAGFLQALEQHSLSETLAEPTLITLDGRPASLQVGNTEIDAFPIVLGDGRVRLECRLKIDNCLAEKGRAISLSSASNLQPGKTFVLVQTPISVQQSGKLTEYHLIVLAKVERSDELARKSDSSDLK